MDIDFEKAAGLLHIAEKALQFGQRFQFIHDAAMRELDAMRPQPEAPKVKPPIEREMRGEQAREEPEEIKRRAIPAGAKFGGDDE